MSTSPTITPEYVGTVIGGNVGEVIAEIIRDKGAGDGFTFTPLVQMASALGVPASRLAEEAQR